MKTIACGLLLFFLSGCTAFQSESLIPGHLELDFYSSTGAHRGMYDSHTYISTYSPNIKISVDPSFEYKPNRAFGKLRYQFLGTDSDVYIHYYTNLQAGSRQNPIYEPIENLLRGGIAERDIVDTGGEELAGYHWAYCIWISPVENGCLMTKDTATTTLDHDVLFLRYVELRQDIVCEQVKNRDVSVAIADWSHALKENFHSKIAFDKADLTTLGLGRHPEKKDRIRRLNDDAMSPDIDYTSGN